MYKVLDVCRHVINYSNDKDYGISNLKLQKILYFIQAYFLISTSEPCFVEPIEAWDLGPVVPVAYHEYKQYGSGDIPYVKSYIKFDEENIWNSSDVKFEDNIISENDKHLMDSVVDKFADFSATDLVTLTHQQAPWKNAYVRGMNNTIEIEAIREYFNG
ncbi:MAG: Panacea domain-containing protein [Lachnospira sp.]